MDIEIHYYVNFLVALQAGFNRRYSYKIAFSSQYVDDNIRKYKILNIANNSYYHSLITQSFNPLLEYDDLCTMYICFHFMPGTYSEVKYNAKKRIDKIQHRFNTIAGGENAKFTLRYALNSKNAYHIGIASHMFLDTWAHQNFTGTFDEFNCTSFVHDRFSIESLIKKIGHMDMLSAPDLVGKIWNDHRLIHSLIDNNQRFLKAINTLLNEYCLFLQHKNGIKLKIKNSINRTKISNKKFLKYIKNIWHIKDYSTRVIEYKRFCNDIFNLQLPSYNKDLWLNNAVKKVVNTHLNPCYIWNTRNYKKTNWYKFQEAAIAHSNMVCNLLGYKEK